MFQQFRANNCKRKRLRVAADEGLWVPYCWLYKQVTLFARGKNTILCLFSYHNIIILNCVRKQNFFSRTIKPVPEIMRGLLGLYVSLNNLRYGDRSVCPKWIRYVNNVNKNAEISWNQGVRSTCSMYWQ